MTEKQSKARRAAIADVAPSPPASIGGMQETTWSGKPMWRCPNCRATTFDAKAAPLHTCKKVRMADAVSDGEQPD